MEITIRPAVPEDFPVLYALDQACFAPGISWSKAELQYFLKYPGNVGLVAQEQDQSKPAHVAGFAIAGRQMRKGIVLGRLITIDVDPAFRRRGVGHMLLENIEERLRRAGAKSLLLEVAVDNTAAQGFYTRHGFARMGRIPGYYMGKIDALVMEKPL